MFTYIINNSMSSFILKCPLLPIALDCTLASIESGQTYLDHLD
jgi:hypothetical protein